MQGFDIIELYFAQNNIFGQIHFELILKDGQSHKKTPLYEKDIKKTLNQAMETTSPL